MFFYFLILLVTIAGKNTAFYSLGLQETLLHIFILKMIPYVTF